MYTAEYKNYRDAYDDYVLTSYRKDITHVRLVKIVTTATIEEQVTFG